MWMIDPKYLCRKHLLGEHNEIHKHRHMFVKKYSINNRINPIVQIEPKNMKSKHDVLVFEMLARGYKHKSPYEQPDISYLPEWQRNVNIDIEYNIKDLHSRCEECKINT